MAHVTRLRALSVRAMLRTKSAYCRLGKEALRNVGPHSVGVDNSAKRVEAMRPRPLSRAESLTVRFTCTEDPGGCQMGDCKRNRC